MTDDSGVRAGTTTGELKALATEIVNRTPPTDVFLHLFAGLFGLIGWVIGRVWFLTAHLVVFAGLAMKAGYWEGLKVPADQRVLKPKGPLPRQ